VKWLFTIALSAEMVLALGSLSLSQQKTAAAPPQANPEAEKALQAAGELMQRGKFEEAEPLLKQAAKLAPSSPGPHNLLGFVYEQL
jgi:Flp pilus assembly protein TadD